MTARAWSGLSEHRVHRPVWFDVLDGRPVAARKRRECTELVDDVIPYFLGAGVDFSSAKSHLVRQAGVDADADVVFGGEFDRFAHDVGIARVIAAGNVRGRNVGHDGLVVAHLPVAETLAHIAVDIDRCHGCNSITIVHITSVRLSNAVTNSCILSIQIPSISLLFEPNFFVEFECERRETRHFAVTQLDGYCIRMSHRFLSS